MAGGDDPGIGHEDDENRRLLLTCLNGLEPVKRRMILLAYVYGMTREEIARETERPVATVKPWLRRSLAQLKACLSQ